MGGPAPRLDLPDPDDGLELDSRPRLADCLGLVLRSARRRPLLAVGVFLLVLDAAVLYYRFSSPIYRVETKILAQRQQALPSVVQPTVRDDVPTRLAWELVHQRENLIALTKDAKVATDAGPEALNALVLRLDRALDVKTAEGTVTISIDWPDPEQAYRLVESALQNFLEARHLREITAIDEVISLLKGRVAALGDERAKAVERAQRAPERAADASARPSSPRAQPSEDLVRLKSMLDAKERAIRDVEEFRQRRLADLQAQLDAQRAIYSEAHPNIINLRQDIEALGHESPQVATLRDQEREMRQQYAARQAQERSQGLGTRPLEASRTSRQAGDTSAIEQDERLREARIQYDRMVERLNGAQLDLDAARAAFKYRYNVIWPPEMPKDPVSPNPTKVFGLGALAAVLLALLAASAPDVLRGRIVERWQVERALGLPVIMQLRRK